MSRRAGCLLPVLCLSLLGGAALLGGEPPDRERASAHPKALRLPHADLVSQAVFSPDGKLLATCGHEGAVRVWDAATGRELHRWPGQEYHTSCVAFSPDGKLLAAPLVQTTVTLFDPAAGKVLRRLPALAGAAHRLAFSPDGKVLAAGNSLSPIHLWDVATGRELHRLDGGPYAINALAFSPDGRLLVSGSQGAALVVWDPAAGKMLRRLPKPSGPVRALAFSPDGRTLAEASDDPVIRLWETTTWQERGRFRYGGAGVLAVAFSPDGRTLAAGGWDNSARLWDLSTRQEHRPIAVSSQQVWVLAFSPDGRRLATIDKQNTALVLDMGGRLIERRPAAPLAQRDLEASWADLCGDSPSAAYRAVWVLAAVPEQAVPLVRQRFPPEVGPAAGQLAALIAKLDDDRFAVRERASWELARLGRWAEPDLRRTLAGQPSLEARRRVERILEELEERGLSAEQVHALRALEVVEHAGTPEARQVLEALAKGAPEARLTQEAKAALIRLDKQTSRP